MNKRLVGSENERKAEDYLQNNGVKILERNYRFHRVGEIDLIGHDGDYLIFIEVKYRKTARAGYAAEAVDYKKIKQICKIANYYIMSHHIPSNKPIRFDVIAIDDDSIKWIKNAFYYAL